MSARPRVSVGMPVRNGERHLEQTLASLLAQTYADFELIISDNASNDGTEEICRAAAARDARVHYVRQEVNLGANANYNEVARLARGELFRWAAHDDLCAPEYLRTCVDLLDEQPDAVLAHTEPLLIDEEGRPLRRSGDDFVQPDGVPVRRPDPPLEPRGLTSESVARRFAGVLLETTWVFEIFGLMRVSALRTTAMQERFYGTDKVLVAEMALRGRFAASTEQLWHRRCHGGSTTNLDIRTRTAWSDPDRLPVPASLQMFGGYHRAVRRAPLSRAQTAACYAVLARKAVSVRPGTVLREVADSVVARRGARDEAARSYR